MTDDAPPPTGPLTTSVSELRALATALFDHLEERGEVVELTHDLYWSVRGDDRRDVLREPTALTIGQLADDLAFLRSMVASQELLGYGLVWLAELLHTIGEDHLA